MLPSFPEVGLHESVVGVVGHVPTPLDGVDVRDPAQRPHLLCDFALSSCSRSFV